VAAAVALVDLLVVLVQVQVLWPALGFQHLTFQTEASSYLQLVLGYRPPQHRGVACSSYLQATSVQGSTINRSASVVSAGQHNQSISECGHRTSASCSELFSFRTMSSMRMRILLAISC
jgi:hypothetical protein